MQRNPSQEPHPTPDPDRAPARGAREIRRLNFLRALAALIVAVSHYSNMSGLWGSVLGKGAGQFGVMLFFILSGFLMGYLYLGQPWTRRSVWRYAVARFARVWPLFALVATVFFIAQGHQRWAQAYPIGDPAELLSHLLLLKGTSILWTIPVEVQFYGLFLIVWWLTDRWPPLLFPASFAGLALPALTSYPDWSGRLWGGLEYDVLVVTSLPYFSAGLLFGDLYRRGVLARLPRTSGLIPILLVVPLMYPPVYAWVFGAEHGMWEDPIVLAAIAGTLFVFFFMVPDSPWVANPVGDHLGKISYSIYLLHLPLVVALEPLVQGGKVDALAFFPVFVAATLVTASLSYAWIEAPARRVLRRRSGLAGFIRSGRGAS